MLQIEKLALIVLLFASMPLHSMYDDIQGFFTRNPMSYEDFQTQGITAGDDHHVKLNKAARNRFKKKVTKNKKPAAIFTIVGCFTGICTIKSYLNMKENRTSLWPVILLGSATTFLLGHGINNLFATVYKDDGNNYYPIGLFTRIKKTLF